MSHLYIDMRLERSDRNLTSLYCGGVGNVFPSLIDVSGSLHEAYSTTPIN